MAPLLVASYVLVLFLYHWYLRYCGIFVKECQKCKWLIYCLIMKEQSKEAHIWETRRNTRDVDYF